MKYLPNPDGSPPDSWIERQPPEPPEDAPIVCPDCKGGKWILELAMGGPAIIGEQEQICPTCRGLGTVFEEELE